MSKRVLISIISLALLAGMVCSVYFIRKNKTSNDEEVINKKVIADANISTSKSYELTEITDKNASELKVEAKVESKYKVIDLKIGDKVFKTEVADTVELQGLGLGKRGGIDEDKAMIFVFQKNGYYAFWMKDMNFAIDMIWLDENMKVIYIAKNISPNTFPKSYQSDKPARYIIEMKANSADKNKIKIGDKAEFDLKLIKN